MVCVVRDVPVYYEQYGQGTPVLCIHGYTVDHNLMAGCLEPVFTDIQGFRRVYIDLPGMGKTPSASWIKNADDMLALVNGFIETIIPDEKLLLIGESYGGYLTLGLIRDINPRIEGVMLICPVIVAKSLEIPKRKVVWKSNDLAAYADDPDMRDFLDMAVILTPEIFKKYKKDVLSGVKAADQKFLSEYGYGFSFEQDLQKVEFTKRMCILTGRQDHVVGYIEAYRALSRFPHATFAVLDCAGHCLQIENKPLFEQHIRDWIWRIGLGDVIVP